METHVPRSEPFFVTLLLRIKSQRATPIAVENFKLFPSISGKEHVSFPEDDVHSRRIIGQQGAEFGDGLYRPSLSKNAPQTLFKTRPLRGRYSLFLETICNRLRQTRDSTKRMSFVPIGTRAVYTETDAPGTKRWG
jgi:hypothetical protein